MAEPYEVTTKKEVEYAVHDGVRLAGDFYTPRRSERGPALVAVHGGGWQQGERTLYQHWGPYLARRGTALFSIDYRRPPTAWPFSCSSVESLAAPQSSPSIGYDD